MNDKNYSHVQSFKVFVRLIWTYQTVWPLPTACTAKIDSDTKLGVDAYNKLFLGSILGFWKAGRGQHMRSMQTNPLKPVYEDTSVRKLGLIEIRERGMHGWSPSQASRVWNCWPCHSGEEGGGGFTVRSRNQEVKEGINWSEGGACLKLTKNDFLAGELWLHQRGVWY